MRKKKETQLAEHTCIDQHGRFLLLDYWEISRHGRDRRVHLPIEMAVV